jgi:cephalosporin-C deacetylase
MPWFDLDPETLKTYRTSAVEPNDMDIFWNRMLKTAHENISATRIAVYKESIYSEIVKAYDVSFSGAYGDIIKGWLLRPRKTSSQTPLVIDFSGYGGGRGLPIEHLMYPALGYSVFVMDIRGQGGSWRIGDTGDPDHGGDSPSAPGVMTKGITDHEKYYFTRLYIDALRAVEEAAQLDGIDPERIVAAGASQGGALSLVVSSLLPHMIKVCIAEIPFLADFPRAIGIASYPYKEIADFLSQHVDIIDEALLTLRYIDTALLAKRITAPTLMALGLMDDIAPPSSVYAVYNAIGAVKDLAVYPFTGHQVPALHQERRIEFIKQYL